MTCSKAIRDRARADLVITTKEGDKDLFLWEHTIRVTRSAEWIAGLTAVRARKPDMSAILAAALYHDAGWIVQYREGEIDRLQILTGPCTATSREHGATVMEQSLADLLSTDVLKRASLAIRALSDREIDTVEGNVVLEADNLEQFGVLSLWSLIRRGAVDGNGVEAAIEKWQRQKEFSYWNARLKESFQFPQVREVAQQRLERFERFMEELEEQHCGYDLVAVPT